jgi:hypothetical protein
MSGWVLNRGCSGWKTTCAPSLVGGDAGPRPAPGRRARPCRCRSSRPGSRRSGSRACRRSPLEGGEARLVDPPPEREVLGIAPLQLHELGSRLLHDRRVGLRGRCCRACRGARTPRSAPGRAAASSRWRLQAQISLPYWVPQSPMWLSRTTRAPVNPRSLRDGLADDGRAQVADMHLLRRVGGAVVDDPGLSPVGRGGPGRQGPAARGGPGAMRGAWPGPGREIDEARPGDRNVEGLPDRRAEAATIASAIGPGGLARLLGGRQDPVGLEIAVPGVGRADPGLEGARVQPAPGRGLKGPFQLADQIERQGASGALHHPLAAGASAESMGRFGSTFS